MDCSGVGGGRECADGAHPSDRGPRSAPERPALLELKPAALCPGLDALAAAAVATPRNGSGACSCGASADQSHNVGVWNPGERRRYQEAVSLVGANNWPAIARHVGTRDASQARTHGVRTRREKGSEGGGGPRAAAVGVGCRRCVHLHDPSHPRPLVPHRHPAPPPSLPPPSPARTRPLAPVRSLSPPFRSKSSYKRRPLDNRAPRG